MREWLKTALDPRVIGCALKYAVIVGTILIFINHGDRILNNDVDGLCLLKMGVTVIVPYFVSTPSSVESIKKSQK